MRNTAFALLLFLATTVTLAAGESMRLNFVKGLYSVNVPANWYVDIDASDSTLTIAQGVDPAAPRVIVAIPNPRMANRLDEYARLAANSFMSVLGGGRILEDKAERDEHGVIFRTEAGTMPFLGAVHAIRDGNYAILTIFLTRESDYERAKDWAAVVMDSLRVDGRALEQQTAFIARQADNLLQDLQGTGGRSGTGRGSMTQTSARGAVVPSGRAARSDPPPTRDSGGLGRRINNPFQ